MKDSDKPQKKRSLDKKEEEGETSIKTGTKFK